jgi:hypothetical protein
MLTAQDAFNDHMTRMDAGAVIRGFAGVMSEVINYRFKKTKM